MGSVSMAPMSMPPAAGAEKAQPESDNPQTNPVDAQLQSLGLTRDDLDKLVQTIRMYRDQWGADRLLRIPSWMKNLLMYRGSQVLAWDNNTGSYFDAVAWWKQNRSEGDAEDLYLERFSCNLTQMFGVGFKGMMSRGVPSSVIKPEDARVLADVTTAKASQEAIGIIERMNKIRQMVREEFETLYLFGSYFKYTRAVLDGEWAGYDEVPQYGHVPVTRPDRYHCFNCETDTPWSPMTQAGTARACPNCSSPLGPETFYPGSTQMEMTEVGKKKVPRAMVRQTVHSPMEVDVDPNAKDLSATPLLSFDQEADIGELRRLFPWLAEQIKEGAENSTSPNASYERLRRQEMHAASSGFTADTTVQRPTFSQNWMTPDSFYRLGDMDFAKRVEAAAGQGLKISFAGDEVVDVRKAALTKQWTFARLHEKFGVYSPAVADNVVPFNERFNDVMQKIDEWVGDSAAGLNVVDGSRIDKEKFNGKALSSSVLNELPMKLHGERIPLSEAFEHFNLPMEAQVFSYPQMLIQFCQLIACLPPQSMGAGTLPGVDTATGQKQMLDVASQALNIYWENGKEEHAAAAQNAIECLQMLLKAGAVNEIWDVIQEKGSQYRNNYVNLSRMKGRVNVYADVDQGLPMSPEQIREVFQNIFKMAGEENQFAARILDVPSNAEQFMATLGTPDLEAPDEAQTAKTEQAINTLLQQDWTQGTDPATGQPTQQLPVMPDKNVDDFPTLKKVMREFRQRNSDLAQTNPGGWARLDAYYEMALHMEAQVAVEDGQRKQKVNAAQAPPQPPPDADAEQARAELLRKASRSVDRLAEIGELPALPKGSSVASQVAAEKEILDTALKAATAGQ